MPIVPLPPMYYGNKPRAFGARVPTKQSLSTRIRIVKVDLNTSTYATGGWPLTASGTGLLHVTDVRQMLGYDPLGAKITAQPTLTFEYIDTDASRPLLKMYVSGVEAGNASTRAGVVWFEFYGRDS